MADEGLEWVHGKESANGVSRAIYHLTVKANGGTELFEDDDDRRDLLGRIAEAASTYQMRVTRSLRLWSPRARGWT